MTQALESLVTCEVDAQGIACLALNQPKSRNALSLAMLQALQTKLEQISRNPRVRVVILAAEGPVFCAGHDLKEMQAQQGDAEAHRRLFQRCSQVMQQITGLPQPVIAQVQGVATAAGCQLVASCDLAVAAQTARFATPGVHIGLFCSTPMVALSRNVSPKHAMQMLLTGDMIGADDAFRMGLVNEVVADEALANRVQALAQQLAGHSAATLALGKKAFYAQQHKPLDQAYDLASETMVENMGYADVKEGIDAFIAKRKPGWKDC